MQVGILGTGDVARALGTGFAGAGHTVKFGTREPGSEKAKALGAVSFADAARFGEVAVLATLWAGTENAIRLAGGASRWRALSSRSR